MAHPKALAGLGLACILAFAVVWRFPVRSEEWRLAFCEGDSLFQLHRVHECALRYPIVPSVDADSHYPGGYRVPWVHLHTLFYATLVQLTGAPQDLEAIAARVSWVPPVLGAVGVLLTALLALRATASWPCALLVALAAALCGEVLRPFLYGIIDHHLFAHLGVLLLALGRMRRSLATWIAGLVALIAMTPEALLFVSLFVVLLFLSDAITLVRGSAARPMPWAWSLSPALVALVVWIAHRAVDAEPLPLASLDWMHLSLFHPLWYACLGGGLRLAADALGSGRSQARFALALGALGAVVTLAGAFLWASGALDTVGHRLLAPERVWVGEEAPVFRAGFWSAPVWYRLLALSGVVLVVELVAAVRRREGADVFFLYLTLLAALAVGFREYRYLYVLSALQIVGLAVAALSLGRALAKLASGSPAIARVVPVAVVALALLPSTFHDALPSRRALAAVCDGLPLAESLATWVAEETPEPRAPGAKRAAWGTFGPWSIGHHLHVLGRRPVVLDPLNFDLDGRFDEAVEATWRAPGAEALMESLAQHDVRYVVLTNPAEEIVGVMRRAGAGPEDYAVFPGDGRIVFLPSLHEFAAFRLFMHAGSSGEFGRLQPRFFTETAQVYTTGSAESGDLREIVVPDGQIYEVKPGARITGRADPADRFVEVRWPLRLGERSASEQVLKIPIGADGRFELHTALPAPHRAESFAVEGAYRLSAGERTAEVVVGQDEVDAGAVVEVTWAEQGSSRAARAPSEMEAVARAPSGEAQP